MPSPRVLLVATIRLLGVLLVTPASLQLALGAAHAIFLLRQGRGNLEALPPMLGWMAVLAAGLGLYARAERLGSRAMAAAQTRGDAK